VATPIRMPQPGQMTEACTILRWLKAEGAPVARGDPLFEIETDKSNMEVEAFDEGTLLRVVVGEGETVPVDTVVAWIGEPGEALPSTPGAPPEASPEATAAPPPSPTVIVPRPAAVPTPSPVAGPQPGASPPPSPPPQDATRRAAMSPRAGRLAVELGVDVRSITGTGPGGRIVERDVRAAADTAGAATPALPGSPARATPGSGDGPPQPLSRLRQVIARRTTESVLSIPHFSVTVAVDMTEVVALRADLQASRSPISLTDLVHAATVQALVEHPLVNSHTDGRVVWQRDRVHLGVAVSVPGGLLVPVVRDADTLGLTELHDRTVAAVDAARAGRLGPNDLSGSTFTVSNMGMYGVERFTAIINPGESGILAAGSVRPEAAALDGGLAVRQVMRLTLSADHRLIDGELAARFLGTLRCRLEDAGSLRVLLSAG
jgi:pyruvate dehydrogenase E2 component (dihydrolipoamide acetyltransferase)